MHNRKEGSYVGMLVIHNGAPSMSSSILHGMSPRAL